MPPLGVFWPEVYGQSTPETSWACRGRPTVDGVDDNRAEVHHFLTSRRARVSPEQAGLPAGGGHRRVPGLRRGEVAALAGVSVEYYSKLERGNLRGASEEVLDALARALRMDESERAHLLDLARAAGPLGRRRPRRATELRPAVRDLLQAMGGVPAFVRDARMDIVAINDLCRALYAPMYEGHTEGAVNLARFCFFSPAPRTFYPGWDASADTTVAMLRAAAGRDPHDKSLSDLVGELSTRSTEFSTRWASHDVNQFRTGAKHLQHPLVGLVDLQMETFPVAGDGNFTLHAYTCPPGSRAAEQLTLLASWTATTTQPHHSTADRSEHGQA